MATETLVDNNIQDPNIIDHQPGSLKVISRTGRVSQFDESRIAAAMKKAFLAVEGDNAVSSDRIHDVVNQSVKQISNVLNNRWPSGGTIHIENIQDLVELVLMRAGEHQVARAYVLYREARRSAREQHKPEATGPSINVRLDSGEQIQLDHHWLRSTIEKSCQGLTDVDPERIIKDTVNNLFDGVALKDVYKAMTMCARTLVEVEPNHSYVTARLLLQDLYNEALDFLGVSHDPMRDDMALLYEVAFKRYIEQGIKLDRLDPELANFDLDTLAQAIKANRDLQFQYLGLQTLYDRYFIHHQGTRFELPQVFFMRVAMGLAINEKDREQKTIEFYNVLSSFDFMSSTPTLFNSGTNRAQLSSCFLTTVPDNLEGIYGAIRDNALLSKFAGGLGNDWTPVRAMGAHIKGTNGRSQGVVPFLNVADATLIAVNQGGKRKGAGCAYLETWHLDIEEFLDLRKNTGDDRRRTHDMNTANWIPDLFMKRVFESKDWTLFSPDETPELHDIYGDDFERVYAAYEEQAREGNIRSKSIPALTLWRKMLSMLFETGHPWMTFKDPCNLRSPQQHVGVVHSSNLCTEITLNTSADEVAVCNLGSINLVNHIDDNGDFMVDKLKRTVKTASRMLDNVIDINYYTIPQAKNSNMKHRPVGLGIMGFQDALYKQGIAYASNEALEFADRSMELISYCALEASSELAEERGAYETFEGSLWSQGILPIDSIKALKASRGQFLEQDTSQTLDWDSLRQRIQKVGVRNSNHLAIAPTATISNICGVSQSIEPTYQNLYVKSNMSGEFTVVNPYLVRDLKRLGLWDNVMAHDLKYYNGSLQQIDRIPDQLKRMYATAFEVEPRWLVEAASRRQKWIDQAQSLNLYMAEPSGKKLDILYRMAWLRGLKTTYYLRSMGATNTEKATISDGALNAVKIGSAAPKACSIDDPDCEACQ